MPADTYSNILGWLVMGTGNDNNSWGTNWNSNVGLVLESAIAGLAVHAVTGGTLDLSGTPPPAGPSGAIEAIHEFTGVLVATQTLIVPNLTKVYFINNKCSGGFGLLVKTTAGTAVNAPAGKVTTIYCAGGNVVVRFDREDVGSFVEVGTTTVPGGTFECAGGTKLIADYPDLYARISTIWGGNGITTFGIPDFYSAGRFLRSRTASVAVGTLQAGSYESHNHTASGTASASSSAVTASGTTSTVSNDHVHGISFNSGGRSAGHTHTGSGTTSGHNTDHTHTGTTGGHSTDHSHTGSGYTGGHTSDHTHTGGGTTSDGGVDHNHSYNEPIASFPGAPIGGGGILAGGGTTGGASAYLHTHTYGFTTSGVSADHAHFYSFTTSGVNTDHSHNFTTYGSNTDHSHTYSFTTSGESGDHTHLVSGSTGGISANHTHTVTVTGTATAQTITVTGVTVNANGSAETRPINASVLVAIRY